LANEDTDSAPGSSSISADLDALRRLLKDEERPRSIPMGELSIEIMTEGSDASIPIESSREESCRLFGLSPVHDLAR